MSNTAQQKKPIGTAEDGRLQREVLEGVRAGGGEMFDRIAPRYDAVNRVISLGLDRSWRARLVSALRLTHEDRVLDLATGTGDLAVALAKAGSSVVGVDPSRAMLDVAAQKLIRTGTSHQIELQLGDAQALPFEDDAFTAASISFGIRNVPDRDAALREMVRVVRPGGIVAVLELGEPDGLFGKLSRFYVHSVVPRVGALLSRAPEYRYLEKSIAGFPSPEGFTAQMANAGLVELKVEALHFGAAHLYLGVVR